MDIEYYLTVGKVLALHEASLGLSIGISYGFSLRPPGRISECRAKRKS